MKLKNFMEIVKHHKTFHNYFYFHFISRLFFIHLYLFYSISFRTIYYLHEANSRPTNKQKTLHVNN